MNSANLGNAGANEDYDNKTIVHGPTKFTAGLSVKRSIIDNVMDLFSERVTPQGDTVQTAQIQKVQTPPLPGTPMPRLQTAQANINPTTNLTPTQEALLSPEEKIIAGRT